MLVGMIVIAKEKSKLKLCQQDADTEQESTTDWLSSGRRFGHLG